MALRLRSLLVVALVWTATPAEADVVAAGGTLAPITLEDQHGAPGGVDAATRGVLFSRDMDAGAFVKEALANDGAARLAGAGAVYVADVHAMPGPIRSFIAIPRMRERPYRVLLDTEGAATESLPSQKGRVTWLRLEELQVVDVQFLDSAAAVLSVLGAAPAGQ
jgi:hypothetical protein